MTDVLKLLPILSGADEGERFDDLLRRPGVRIERIESHGHVAPADQPYVQDWDEWVLVLSGAAELDLDGTGRCRLGMGEALLIPAGTAHRVTYTADPTIWLAIHLGETEPPAAG
ncbi:cupin 2 domain-containing protein [Novosphingobium sp. PhB57]|nr:cupin 2 domain-containing protein [Novosphingobium sp. PhB57]